MAALAIANFTAGGQQTDGVLLPPTSLLSISIISTAFVGTIALQRSFDSGATWVTVLSWTDSVETTYTIDEEIIHRLAVTAFTSGSAAVRLGAGTK